MNPLVEKEKHQERRAILVSRGSKNKKDNFSKMWGSTTFGKKLRVVRIRACLHIHKKHDGGTREGFPVGGGFVPMIPGHARNWNEQRAGLKKKKKPEPESKSTKTLLGKRVFPRKPTYATWSGVSKGRSPSGGELVR